MTKKIESARRMRFYEKKVNEFKGYVTVRYARLNNEERKIFKIRQQSKEGEIKRTEERDKQKEIFLHIFACTPAKHMEIMSL